MTAPQVETRLHASLADARRARGELWLVLSLLTLLYVIVVTIGNRRYVWFDELFTFNIAGSASLQQLWYRELRFDCNPPALYLLSRASMAVLGKNPLGLRFPSMVEFYFGSVAMLLFVRRKAGIAFAALGVLLIWTVAPTLYYAVEARPYALVFLAFSCLLLCWDSATRVAPRRWAIAGVAIFSTLLLAAHVFAVFTFLAFLVAEAVRLWRRRRFDTALAAALLLPMAAMLIYLPLIRSCSGIIFPVRASWNTIILFLEETLAAPIIPIVLLTVLLIPGGKAIRNRQVEFLAEDKALLAGLFLSPLVLSLFLMIRKATFYSRYCLAAQVAMLLTIAIFLPYRMRLERRAAYAGSVLLLLFLLKTQVWHAIRYPAPANAAFIASIHPELPLVASEGQVFMEMNQYESASFLSRLYFLKDPTASLQYLHTNIFQEFEAPDVMKSSGYPITANIAPYDDFVRHHHQFLLLGSPLQWVFTKLRLAGASFTVVGDYRGDMPYLDTTLYLVTVPTS